MNRELERKRLMELLKHECDVDGRYDGEGNCPGCKYNGMEDCSLQELADHLLDNGIVVPPVKVGQTVYYVCGIHNKLVEEAKIEEIYYNGESYMYLVNSNYLHFEMTPDELYSTREEAEKALEGSGDE